MFDDRKIIVLDDDPTGTQTVHGVPVFTDWEKETLRCGFEQEKKLFFVLTNSRSFSREKTIAVHREIGRRIREISEEQNQKYLVISRADSTLRGHYPQETESLAQGLGEMFDGEIICPFFPESGRYTKGNIHYVQIDGVLVPAGATEFANDRTFAFHSSNLCEWVEEKTNGRYKAQDCLAIPEGANNEMTLEIFMKAHHFQKVVVNALSYKDLQAVVWALDKALKNGKQFLFRTAAAFVKAVGEIEDRPLLKAEEICEQGSKNGGLLIIGSHVQKTTRQLEALKKEFPKLGYFEFNAESVQNPKQMLWNRQRAADFALERIQNGCTAVIYTSRKRIEIPGADSETQLQASVQISDMLTSVVGMLPVRPRYLLAKGGITSSDVATKALHIRRAQVLGQAAPGIPVWQTQDESLFPGLSYIIFPGNVGTEETLLEVVAALENT